MKIINRNNCPEFIAQDKAMVRELVSPRNSSIKSQSIAEVRIPSGESVLEHFHEKTEEVYYILSGRGQMYVDGETETVGSGDAIIILPGQRHKIANNCEEDLVMLVVCSPSYSDEDQILV
jgi:mannose-6-phosphate isomerase-like protein (cupin superfamily)